MKYDIYFDEYTNKTWTKDELMKNKNFANINIKLQESIKQKELVKEKIRSIKSSLEGTLSIETALMLNYELKYITQKVDMLTKLSTFPIEEIYYFDEYISANATSIVPLSKVGDNPQNAARASLVLSSWKKSIEEGYQTNMTNIIDINNKKNAAQKVFGNESIEYIGAYISSDPKENIRLIADAKVRLEEEELINKLLNPKQNIKM